MKAKIYCTTVNGMHNFYLKDDNGTFYLYTQDYRRSVQNYYGKGVVLDKALDFSKSKRDRFVVRTMKRLYSYIRYIEKEYMIDVLAKTKLKNAPVRRESDDRSRYNDSYDRYSA